MAIRMISTGFWKDPYIVDLESDERLTFLYLLTNPQTNIAGIYELSIREICFDTGLDKKRMNEIFAKFIRDKKMSYFDGWVALHNWIKHQSKNPKVTIGINRIIEELPEWLKKQLLEPDSQQSSLLNDSVPKAIDSVSKPIALNLTKLNLTKLNSTEKSDDSNKFDPAAQTPEQKRQYAIAMKLEREQKEKAKLAKTRPKAKPVNPINGNSAYQERKWR